MYVYVNYDKRNQNGSLLIYIAKKDRVPDSDQLSRRADNKYEL